MTEKELIKCLSDQYWRLNNLYWITDKDGRRVKFKMNRAQELFFKTMHFKNIILKARQLGFSTFLQIYMLDIAIFHPDTNCGTIAHTLKDAQTLFRTKVKFAYDNLPEVIRKSVPLVACNSTEMLLGNNSSIIVGTSLRSGTYQYLHISEFGKIAARFPERAREIVTGALNTQAPGQFAFIESTAEGQEGRFYKMVQRARSLEAMNDNDEETMTDMDWKFHFFPWFDDPAYRINPKGVIIPPILDKYFSDLELEHDIKLSDEQKAWYASKAEEQADDMSREFPSHPDEAFAAAIEGAYFGELMARLEKGGQITNVPYDPDIDVETWWDLGMSDAMSIWFVQRMPSGALNVIDYYENSGEALQHYAKYLDAKPYRYSRHVGPHDSAVRELGSDGKSRKEVAESLGMRPWEIAARIDVMDGIQQVRSILPRCYFDKTKCEKGIKALKSYRKEWDEKLGTWKSRPRHDWSSHCADAFRTGASAPAPLGREADWDRKINVPNFGAV